MDASKKRRLDSYCLRDPLEVPPIDKIQSEKTNILKELAARQQSVLGDLNHYLNNKKEFVSTRKHSLEHCATGIKNLREFLEVHENESIISRLLDCGLSKSEIEIKLQDEGKGLATPRSLLEPRIKGDILKNINDRILKKEEEVSQIPATKGIKSLSRLQFELEETLKPNSELLKLSTCLYYQSKAGDDKLFRLSNERLSKKLNHCESTDLALSNGCDDSWSYQFKQHSLKAPRNVKPKSSVTLATHSKSDYGNEFHKLCGPRLSTSGWDSEVLTWSAKPSKVSERVKVKKTNWFTIDNGRIVQVKKNCAIDHSNTGNFVACPKQNTIQTEGKLSLDKIRAIEKFQHYNPGIPSKVLYLKNFGRSWTETNLVELFSQYESNMKSRLVYRVLKGRMKGQAFVTFPDIETAKQALEDKVGLLINSRPLIIEYGKQ